MADFLEKGDTDYYRFHSWVRSNNNRVSDDDPRVQKQFDRYVCRYNIMKGLAAILMVGCSTWCVYYLVLICKLV